MRKAERIHYFVERKIEQLIANADTGTGKSSLSYLRKGLGRKPGELPDLWGELLLGMPEDFYGEDGYSSKEEWACYLAITLFALHQQGRDAKILPMHEKNMGLGRALYLLSSHDSDENGELRIFKRLKALSTSKNVNEMGYHLRQIIQLLKGKNIPLDYGLLAEDLFKCQYDESSSRIHLRWGQEFYSQKMKEEHREENENA